MSTNTILATAPLTTTGYHIKATGTTLGNSLIWDNGTNVGIGNTNTSYTLDVSGTGNFTGVLRVSAATGFAVGSIAGYRRIEYGSSAATSFTFLTNADGYAGIYAGTANFSGDTSLQGNNYINSAKMIQWEGGSYWSFRTVTSATEFQLYQGSTGNTPIRVGSGGLVYLPYVYTNTGGGSGTVAISASGELYRATSSLKYKENVIDYSKGLAEVLQLRPVYYNVKREDDNNLYAGLIAEEIEEIGLTEFVQYAEDGTPDSIYYPNMIALLTKAIQEQNQTIQSLQEQINILAK